MSELASGSLPSSGATRAVIDAACSDQEQVVVINVADCAVSDCSLYAPTTTTAAPADGSIEDNSRGSIDDSSR